MTAVAVDPDNYLISKNNKVVAMTSLKTTPVNEASLAVSPNPVTSMATVDLKNMQGKIQLQLFNNNGNVIWNKQADVQNPSTKIQIPFTSFISGNYTLTATDATGKKYTVTIVK